MTFTYGKLFLVIIAVSFSTLLIGFKGSEQQPIHVKIEGVDAVVTVLNNKEPKGNDIRLLFDNDEKTGANTAVSITFSKLVYIKSIDVTLGGLVQAKNPESDNDGTIVINGALNGDTTAAEQIKTPIDKNVKRYLIKNNNRILGLLRIGYMSIFCGDYSVNEIKIHLKNKPVLYKTMKLKDVEGVFGKDIKDQKNGGGIKAELFIEAMWNLVSSALEGNKRAEQMLNVYSPAGVADQEFIGDVRYWYKKTKETNTEGNF